MIASNCITTREYEKHKKAGDECRPAPFGGKHLPDDYSIFCMVIVIVGSLPAVRLYDTQ